MESRYPYLHQINKNYYFRIKVPKHLKPKCSLTEIKKTLLTNNLNLALYRVKIMKQIVSMIFKQIENNMISKDQLKKLMKNVTIKDDDQEVPLNASALEKEGLFKVVGSSNSETEDNSSDLLNAPLPAGEGSRTHDLIQAVRKQIPDADTKEMFGEILSKLPKQGAIDKAAPLPNSTRLVKDLISEYMNEKSNDNHWKRKTAADYWSVFNLFLEVHGDKQIGQITRPVMTHYRDEVLKRLPKNRNKGVRAKMSLAELLADTTHPTISLKRINNNLTVLSGFFSWCIEEHGCMTRNYAQGLSIKDRRHPSQRRDIYTDEELEKIVVGLSKLKPTPVMKDRHIEWTWIALIGLCQGMRENEICQLGVNNIAVIQGVPCFSITEEDIELFETKQSVKNLSSMRTVPIHDDLLRLGFLRYVNKRRTLMLKTSRSKKATAEGKEYQRQLFPSMTYSASKDTFITNFYNFYSKFNTREVTSNPKATFHSLRHNFSTILNNSSKVPYAI